MTRSLPVVSTLLLCALSFACAPNEAGPYTEVSASTTSPTNPSGNESGSVTSAAEGSASTSADPTMATTTTTSTSTSDASSSTSQGCQFLNCDDMQNVMNECDNWAQDCPEGQKCAAYIAGGGGAWDALKCVDVTGTDKPGDECTSEGAATGIDSCIKGAMCWYVDQEGIGRCLALCSGTPDAPVCENGLCTISGGGELNLCLPDCDPLLQDCTGEGAACYPIADGFTCAPDASGEEGQANDPCEFINVCDAGLMCAEAALVGAGCEAGATGCCTPFCEFPDGPCPNPDQSCVQYFDPGMFPENDPLLDIGSCGVPT